MKRYTTKKAKGIFVLAVSLCLGLAFIGVACDGGGNSGGCGITPTPTGQVDCSGSKMLSIPAGTQFDELGPYPVASRYVYVTNPDTPPDNRYYKVPFRVQILYPTTTKALEEAGIENLNDPKENFGKKVLTIEDIKWYLPDVHPIPGVIPPTYPTDWYELADENLDKNDRENEHFIPIDKEHGPYPVIFMVHGTSSSTTSHYTLIPQWASRGFVVIMADYNGINMRDMLESIATFGDHREIQDTRFLVDQVKSQSGVFDMLKGQIDINRMGIAGHSWGGSVAGQMAGTPGIRVSIPLASIGVNDSPEIATALIMGAKQDTVLNYQRDSVAGYEATKARKRLVGIPSAGHMAFADVCDIVLLADSYGVTLDDFVAAMATDGCNDPLDPNPQFLNQEITRRIVKYATTAAFEETLQCSAKAGQALDENEIKSYFDGSWDTTRYGTLEFRESGPTPNNQNRMPLITDGLFRPYPKTPN